MKTSQRAGILAIAIACSANTVPVSQPTSAQAPAVVPPPLPTCTFAENKEIRFAVTEQLYHKDKTYLPKDKNWIQISATVQNKSNEVVTLVDIKAKQNTGTAVAVAQSGLDLAQPPSMTGEAAKTTALVGVGQFAGAFLFPPLALASSAFALFGGMGKTESWGKRVKKIDDGILRPQAVPPETAVQGLVFSPALTTFSSLVLVYSTNKGTSALSIPCSTKV